MPQSHALGALVWRLYDIRRDTLPDSHFILGLDEAQHASRLYPRCFMSSTKPNEFRSIIRAVTKVFTEWSINLVVSGTSLSLAELHFGIASGVGKPLAVELFHELGMFDTWPKLKSFLEAYIPPSIFESDSGNRLQKRIGISSGTVSRHPPFQPNESHWRQVSLLRILCGILPEKWAAIATQIAE